MYHRHSAGAISYAEFRHLGKKGVLGRYSSALSPGRRHHARQLCRRRLHLGQRATAG